MQALLGKISRIEYIENEKENERNTGSGPAAGARMKIGFKAACLLPERKAAPAWLKDQTLSIERHVLDAREIGGPGDSVVLTTAESALLLHPLSVMPQVARGGVPDALQLTLCWWKDDAPPEWSVRANGRLQSGAWQKAEDGDGWTAQVETASFFDFAPRLPVAFEIECDKLRAGCAVVPADESWARELPLPQGTMHRVENRWYETDVAARLHGGAIAALRERGRGVDHFLVSEERVGRRLEYGGHSDRYRNGWGSWSDKMRDAVMTSTGARREGATMRLCLEGVVDEGEGLRTSVALTFHDELPLIALRREWSYAPKKGDDDDDKDKDDAPKEPADELHPMQFSFRCAARSERDGGAGSRVLCGDGEGLAVLRPVALNHLDEHHYWRMRDGWAILEHPLRRECILYLFDAQWPPHLATWLGERAITLEPFWPFAPVRADGSAGYALALSAGELCGASERGGWVACRALQPAGGMVCAAVARLRDPAMNEHAAFTLAGQTREAPLRSILIPGVGEVLCAVVEFENGDIEDELSAIVAGIPARRELA